MSLKDELTDIHGIGESKTEEIMTVFEDYDSTNEVVESNLREAMDYYNNNEYEYAGKFLRRAVEGLE